MVDATYTAFVRVAETLMRYHAAMQDYFIAGRTAVTDALSLVDEYGADAPIAAAMRAVQSRDVGNVLKFCHWRQIERLSALLASNNVEGSLH